MHFSAFIINIDRDTEIDNFQNTMSINHNIARFDVLEPIDVVFDSRGREKKAISHLMHNTRRVNISETGQHHSYHCFNVAMRVIIVRTVN